jgi:hypothetical protein
MFPPKCFQSVSKLSLFETGTSYIPLVCGFTDEKKSLVVELSSHVRLNYTLCVNHENAEQKKEHSNLKLIMERIKSLLPTQLIILNV